MGHVVYYFGRDKSHALGISSLCIFVLFMMYYDCDGVVLFRELGTIIL